MMERKIRRGEIYIADLDPVVGSEQGGETRVGNSKQRRDHT